uniref:Fucosyltransferase n=1 Tax=Parastrongyloides trichosuri TaxID=131310 RepID=A0A0N4ZW22_PARTI
MRILLYSSIIILVTLIQSYCNYNETFTIISWNWRPWEDFGYCQKYNCLFTKDRKLLHRADAVLFNDYYFSNEKYGKNIIKRPKNTTLFVNVLSESIRRLHIKRSSNKIKYPKNYFNLTLSYLPYADINLNNVNTQWVMDNITNERVKEIDEEIGKTFEKKSMKVLWLVSNCRTPSGRENAVRYLKKYIKIHQFGKCSKSKVLLNETEAKELFEKYYFYIASENTDCRHYITEKFFGRLPYFSIPIVNCRKIYEEHAPTSSFIAMDDFKSPFQLAYYLKYLIENKGEYLKYFNYKKQGWRQQIIPTGRCHYCNELIKFNLSKKKKTYFDITNWLKKANKCLVDNYVSKLWKMKVMSSDKVFHAR